MLTRTPSKGPRSPIAIVAVASLLPVMALAQSTSAQGPGAGRGEQEWTTEEVPETAAQARAVLEQRRQQQLREVPPALEVFHDFRFEDHLEQSGITFVHRVTDDAGKYWKPVHYDHGNGLSVADVDGDGLLDLYFLTQLGSNELWRNTGEGRFENITGRSGTGMAERISVAATFADLDNDGDPDLYVTTVRMGNVLFENRGNGRFRNRTGTSGLGYNGHSSTPICLDFDRDGLLDILLTNVGRYTTDLQGEGGYYRGRGDAFQSHLTPERNERSLLYRNLGGLRFEDVSDQLGYVDNSWAGDATLVDWNRDQWPDLYVLNMQGDDHYWENQQGKRFVDRTAALFPSTPYGAMGVKVFDHDNDGLLDLLITDMHSDMSEEIGPEREHLKSRMQWSDEELGGSGRYVFGNAFYRQRASADSLSFEESSDALGLENYWPWGVSVGDLNADGFQDVLITSSMNFPFRYGINSLKLNNRGRGFLSTEFLLGIEPRRDQRVKTWWFDVDCTDPVDRRNHPTCQSRSGKTHFHASLGSRTAALLDLDSDGDLDIVTGEFNSEPQVLVSNLSERKRVRFLAIELQGTASSRDALGAEVKVVAGDLVQVQLNDGKSGYLSQSSMPLYFGLGDAAGVDRIEVTWPSGRRQVEQGPIAIDRLMVIEEPE